LSSVLNTLDALSDGVYVAASEKGATRINEAVQNIDRMELLISDLLQMREFDASALSLQKEKTSLTELIEEALGSVRAYAEQQKIALVTELTDCNLHIDRGQMVRVVINLLANAIKFSISGSQVIARAQPQTASVRIEITDHGVGIPLNEQASVFEPYKQSSQEADAHRVKGTGLGLTICKSIVEAHGGKIGVESALPQGSTFWIELPVETN
ncbi:MAG TPA: HAMP domain-containing sensor histidine kinase, partial [Chroococcales cyanobacterium]